ARSVMSAIGDWGARIRTWDHGTKTRCLTTWPRPRAPPTLTAIGEDVEQGHEREDHHRDDRRPEDDEGEDGGERGEELRDREDPRDLMAAVGARSPAGGEVEDDRDDGEREDGEARDVVEDRHEDRLDRGDPERDAGPPLAQPAPGAARRRDCVRRVAQHVINRTTLVRSARCARARAARAAPP